MARIYRRPESKVWQCCYTIPGNPKPVRESTDTEDETKARQFLESRIRETGYKKVVGPAAERAKFADLERLIVDDYKVKGRRSAGSLGAVLAHLKAAFGRYRANQITSAAIAAYTADRITAGAAPASVNRELACIRRMFKLGRKHGVVELAPYIELLPENNARQVYFTHQEFVAARDQMPEELRGFLSALDQTGIRRTQMALLEWRDINWESNVAVFRGETTKNTRPHTVPLAGGFGEAIADAKLRRRLDCRFVFHLNGKPLVYKDGSLSAEFRALWDAARTASNLEGRYLHDFRRSAAHHLSEAGVSEQVGMSVTGHLTPGMYRRYNIIAVESVAAAMERHSEYVGTLPSERVKVTKL